MPKIIQIQSAPWGDGYKLFGLSEDGELWMLRMDDTKAFYWEKVKAKKETK